MPILIQRDCPCCSLQLHHCKKCWEKFHHGERDDDYEEPEYYGEPFFSEEVLKSMEKELGVKPKVKPQKDRKYKEGCYGH